MCNRRFKYNVHESSSFIQWLNHSPLQLQSLRSFGFMLVHVMYGFFSPFCTFNFAHCSFYLPIHFLCMLLLNVPSTWWPLCVNSQMQLKVVCVFVLFFIISPCNLKVAWLQIVALLSYLWNHGHCTLLQYALISLTVCLLSKHITIMAIDAILRVLCHLYVCSL